MSDFDQLMHDIEQEAISEKGPRPSPRFARSTASYTSLGSCSRYAIAAGSLSAGLSELTGVQQADISRIERGETLSTTVTAMRLADALGADFGFYEFDTKGKAFSIEPVSIKAGLVFCK